jgi:hypothetical protein
MKSSLHNLYRKGQQNGWPLLFYKQVYAHVYQFKSPFSGP